MTHPKTGKTPPGPRRRVLALALVAALGAGAVLAETGTVLKDTQLRASPLASADVVAELKAKDNVEITARQGAWAGVKTQAGAEGWARVLNLRTGSAQAAVGGGGDQLASLFLTGSTGTTVSTGVKGLSADQLMSAYANHAEVGLLDGYATSNSDASQFAAEVPLATQQVAYLAEEQRGRRRR